MRVLRIAPRDGIPPATFPSPWEVHMKMFRFFAVAVAMTAFVAGCATTMYTTMDTSPSYASPPFAYPGAMYPDPPLIDQSKAAGPTSVPGSFESP